MSITIVGGGNPSGPTYPLQRSVRLRSSASAYFNRTLTTPTNNKIWTWSAWVKKGKPSGTSAASQTLFATGSGSTDAGSTLIIFDNERIVLTGYTTNWLISTAVYRDPSAWYHILVAWDNSNATVNNRSKIYVNGLEIVYATDNRASLSTSSTYGINQAVLHTLGAWSWNNGSFAQPSYFDGYMTEVNFIDGQALTPTSFGAYNSFGVWSPAKYTGTYGTNGFYLNFQDNSAATAAAIGKDSSGNGNNWTPNNISVTAGVTYDSMLDVPTLTSATNANFAVINPISTIAFPVTNGNLSIGASVTSNRCAKSSIAVSSGKWYWEFKASVISISGQIAGICSADALFSGGVVSSGFEVGYYSLNGNKYVNGTGSAYGASWTASDTIGVALDVDGGTVTFYKNNTSQGAIAITAGQTWVANWTGQNTTDAVSFTFGQQPFVYTPPTGFKSLNTFNLSAPTIPNGATQFAATTYTGTGSSLAISNTVNGKSFTPDFVWVKGRSGATDHALYDSVRGTTKQLESNATIAETTEATGLTAFGTEGFTVGALAQMNTNTATYVGWQWKANGTPAVINTAGSVPSTISANTTSGFSIVTFTCPASGNFTVGHGLGIAPAMMILKTRSGVDGWYVYNKNFVTPTTGYLQLNLTSAVATSVSLWGSTNPTSSVATMGTGGGISAGATGVLYCFAEIAGFSKFGSYTGNGSTDGPFVYLGFRPRWVMIKSAVGNTGSWWIYDSSRDTYNVEQNFLMSNNSNTETVVAGPDFLSNGFKLRTSQGDLNTNGSTFIYAAFAENPFNYSLAR